MIEWVESTGYTTRWLPATCRGIRTTTITAEERNLLWLVLHSAVRLGYRRLSELRDSTEAMTVAERAVRRDQAIARSVASGQGWHRRLNWMWDGAHATSERQMRLTREKR